MKFTFPIFILILIPAIIFLLRFFHADVTSLHFWCNVLYGFYVLMTCVIIILTAMFFDDYDSTDREGAAIIMSIILAFWTYAKFF